MIALFSVIGALQLFNEPTALKPLTNAITSTWVPLMRVYSDAFVNNNIYGGAASAFTLLVMTVALTVGGGVRTTDDIRKLLSVINGLVDKGNTVIVIEHNLDVIKTSDWVVDMGPEGGAEGGTVVAEGTPEDVAAVPESYTGQFLRPLLEHAAVAA